MGNWKLVNYRTPKKRGKAADAQRKNITDKDGDDWRLYDLRVDIGEKNDIADAHPAIVEKMLGLLKTDGLL